MKELTYQVPRQAYTALLADMIRRNERRPIRIMTLLLLTVGQMAAVLVLCLFRLEGGERGFFWDRPMLEIRKDAPVNTTAHLG